MSKLKSWFTEHYTLVFFLVAQAAAILTYAVRLETRVYTLETRGSPHLAEINNRLTVTEKETEANKARIDRVVEIMTRELNVKP